MDYPENYAAAIRYSRSTHDAIIAAANDPGSIGGKEGTLPIFADYLQENGFAGGNLARDGAARLTASFPNHRARALPIPGALGGAVRAGRRVQVVPYATEVIRPGNEGDDELPPISLDVSHWMDDTPMFSSGSHYLRYSVPVYSREHLVHLMSDFESPEARAQLWQATSRLLPSKGMPDRRKG